MAIISGNTVSCDCSPISEYDNTVNICLFKTGCHPTCKSLCNQQNSNLNCFSDCQPALTKTPTSVASIYACTCPLNSDYNSELQICIYNKNCHPLCGGKCFEISNSNSCYQSCSKFAILSSAKTSAGSPSSLPKLSCLCPSDTEYDAGIGRCLYTKNCHAFCKDGKCASKGNNNECIGDCISETVKGVNSLNDQLTTCSCPSDMEISPTAPICLYNKGCHPLCGRLCLMKDNNTACYKECMTRAVLQATSQSDFVNCSCKPGSIFAAEDCLINQNCHPLCGKSICYEENNPSQCYASCSQIAIVKSQNKLLVSCGCPENQAFSDNLCLYNKGCHPLCGGLCYKQYDNTECYKRCIANTTWSITGLKIKCTCPNGYNSLLANTSSLSDLQNFNGSICAEVTLATKQAGEKEKAENATQEKAALETGSITSTSAVALVSVISSGNLSKLLFCVVRIIL